MTRLELASVDRNMTTRKTCERSMGFMCSVPQKWLTPCGIDKRSVVCEELGQRVPSTLARLDLSALIEVTMMGSEDLLGSVTGGLYLHGS